MQSLVFAELLQF